MNILEKRPLSLILCIMLGVFSLFADFSISSKLVILSVLITLLCASFIFNGLFIGRITFIRLCIIASTIALLLSVLWMAAYFPSSYYGTEPTIEGKIYDIDNESPSSTVVTLKTTKINGKFDRHQITVYFDKEDAVYLKQYDKISFIGEIAELSNSENGFDARSYYISRGYSAVCEYSSDLKIIKNSPDYIDKILNHIALKISNTLKIRTNFDTGAFLTALIIGDRSDLDGNTTLNFLRTGISHILALSGMHIALLSITLNRILSVFRVNKKIRIIIVSLFAVFYMGLTGFSTSVSRAAIMLIITGVLYLLKHKSDPLTSLFISIAVILIIWPNAAYDLSLWLSAFATLGVICFAELSAKNQKQDTFIKRSLCALKDSALVSVFAFGATLIICALKFDGMSTISILSTILFSGITNLLIYSGILLLLFGWILPFGRLVILLSDFIKLAAEALSNIKWIYASIDSVVTKVFIAAFCALFFAFIFFKVKKQTLCIILIIVLMFCTFSFATVDTVVTAYDNTLIFSPSRSCDSILVKTGGSSTLIISGKTSNSSVYEVLDFITDEKTVYIDNIIITNYTYSTSSFVKKLIDNVKTATLHLPAPITVDEISEAEFIADMLSIYGTDLSFYRDEDAVSDKDMTYRLHDREGYTYGVVPMNVFTVTIKDNSYTYLSSGETEFLSQEAKMVLQNSKNIIIGTPSTYDKSEFYMLLPNIENIYKHTDKKLAERAEDYFKEKGASIKSIETPIILWD